MYTHCVHHSSIKRRPGLLFTWILSCLSGSLSLFSKFKHKQALDSWLMFERWWLMIHDDDDDALFGQFLFFSLSSYSHSLFSYKQRNSSSDLRNSWDGIVIGGTSTLKERMVRPSISSSNGVWVKKCFIGIRLWCCVCDVSSCAVLPFVSCDLFLHTNRSAERHERREKGLIER